MSLFNASASCVGGSLAIYDPDQDPDGTDAARIVEFVRNVLVRPTISP
jgi:arginase